VNASFFGSGNGNNFRFMQLITSHNNKNSGKYETTEESFSLCAMWNLGHQAKKV